MSIIDWSKAPEGTTHHVEFTNGGHQCFIRHVNKYEEYYWDAEGWSKVYGSHVLTPLLPCKTITPNPLLNKGDTQMKEGYTDEVTYEVTKEIVENAPEGTTHICLFDETVPYLSIESSGAVDYWSMDLDGRWITWYTHDDPINPKPIEDFKHLLDEVVEESSEGTFDFPKQERYGGNQERGDFVDRSYESMSFERFTGAMQWTIDKYFDRLGKKDPIEKEAKKIADYAQRFYQKVLIEVERRNKEENK